MFQGAFTALITPFKDGEIDYAKMRELVERQIAAGIGGVVPCGTTGESATMTHEEHKKLVSEVVQMVGGRVPVIAGAGSNCTREAIELTQHAAKAGADAALVITPYYNKPEPDGMYLHFKAVGESADIPIVLYNVPSRTGRSITPETVARIVSDCKNVVAVKEASGSMDQSSEILSLCDVTILSGDDSATLPLMALGAKGVISVVSNVVPTETQRMVSCFLDGDVEAARKLHYRLFPLSKSMFIETNPIPVKTAAGTFTRCPDTFN